MYIRTHITDCSSAIGANGCSYGSPADMPSTEQAPRMNFLASNTREETKPSRRGVRSPRLNQDPAMSDPDSWTDTRSCPPYPALVQLDYVQNEAPKKLETECNIQILTPRCLQLAFLCFRLIIPCHLILKGKKTHRVPCKKQANHSIAKKQEFLFLFRLRKPMWRYMFLVPQIFKQYQS